MKIRLLILSVAAAVFLGAAFVQAAEVPVISLSFPAGTHLAPGSEFVVWVTVSSETPVNAFDISLSYSSELELIGFDTSGSLTDMWQEGPRVRPDRIIELVGGIRSPFQGNAGRLVGIEFHAVNEGEVRFVFDRVRFYAADGDGTELAGTTDDRTARVAIITGAPLVALASPVPDATAPALNVAVAKTDDRAVLLAFDAQDVDSGIVATLVRTRAWFAWSEWRPATNPVLIPRSVWSAELIAINGAGLETVAKVYSWEAIIRGVGLIFALIFVGGSVRVVYNVFKQPRLL
jgi:hypothetical protein